MRRLSCFSDGKSKAYYIKCNIEGSVAAGVCDLNARLDVDSEEAFRSNRELLLKKRTYKNMRSDALRGREFNDVIVEYSRTYEPARPLKVWGGQHRIRAIMDASEDVSRNHGFRVYFGLNTNQRNELAFISNTNIAVSKDTFDRMIEETIFGDALRKWCRASRLLPDDVDFPDSRTRSELITVKLARTFIINFYHGKETGRELNVTELNNRVYSPIIAKTGIGGDPVYAKIREDTDILSDESLLESGERFADLNCAQRKAFDDGNTRKNTPFRKKAYVESVLCGWSFVAGLLQPHRDLLSTHFAMPKPAKEPPDPLNAETMSEYRHDLDLPTYRGLGTRTTLKDRQRVAQLFVMRSIEGGSLTFDLMDRAVSRVVGIQNMEKSR